MINLKLEISILWKGLYWTIDHVGDDTIHCTREEEFDLDFVTRPEKGMVTEWVYDEESANEYDPVMDSP